MNAVETKDMFTLLSGILVEIVTKSGQILPLEAEEGADGVWFLPTPKSGKHTLRVAVAKGYRYFVAVANKDHNISDATEVDGDNTHRATYAHEFLVEGREQRFVRHPNNCLRIIKMRPGGIIEMYELAIIIQGNWAYLTLQRTWEVQAYDDGTGKVKLPALWKWETLMDWLTVRRERLGKLPSINEYVQPEEPAMPELEPGTGMVKYFSAASGTGVVATRDHEGNKQDVRVHWSQCPPRGDTMRLYLVKGELVTWRVLAKNGQPPLEHEAKHIRFATPE